MPFYDLRSLLRVPRIFPLLLQSLSKCRTSPVLEISKHVHTWQSLPCQRPDPTPKSPKSHSHRGTSSLAPMLCTSSLRTGFGRIMLEMVEDVPSRLLCIRGRMTLVSRVRLIQNPSVEGRFSQTILTARLFLNRRKTLDFIWYTISGVRSIEIVRPDCGLVLREVAVRPMQGSTCREPARSGCISCTLRSIRDRPTPVLLRRSGRASRSRSISISHGEDVARYHRQTILGDLPGKPVLKTSRFTVPGVSWKQKILDNFPAHGFILCWVCSTACSCVSPD